MNWIGRKKYSVKCAVGSWQGIHPAHTLVDYQGIKKRTRYGEKDVPTGVGYNRFLTFC
jgi:hypothetical protein